jgi:acyl-[acyl carrier protein]--UDP-N-acetylglucosamine O-acyltransferase
MKETYRIIYQLNLTVKDALQKVEDEIEPIDEVQNIISFFRESERGVIR